MTQTKAKCTKVKIAWTKREKELFFKFVNLWRSCSRQRVNRAVWQTNVSSKDDFTENSQSKKQASHAILMHCFLVLCIQICNVTYILLTNSLQRWSSQSWYNREFKKRPLERQGQRHKPIIWLISGTRENNRAARAVRLLVQFFDKVCQTMWNFHICGV